MINHDLHAVFFSKLDKMEQMALLEAFGAISTIFGFEDIGIFMDLPPDFMPTLERKVVKYLRDLRQNNIQDEE